MSHLLAGDKTNSYNIIYKDWSFTIFLFLVIASVALLILVISTTTIVRYNDPFDYVLTLPYYFWIGLGCLFTAMLVLLNKHERHELYDITALALLSIYMLVLPILITENPRHQDEYLHGGEVFDILSSGYVNPNLEYSHNYPLAFIFMAGSLLTTNLNEIVFFKLFASILTLLLVTMLYYTTRQFNDTFALVAPLALIGSFWTVENHFSPQGLALILYSIIFLALFHYIKNNNRSWLFLVAISVILINLSNPTNSYILSINLIIIIIIFYLFRRRIDNIQISIMFIFITMLLGWASYNAETTFVKLGTYTEELTSSFGLLTAVKITPNPNPSYAFINELRLLVSSIVLSTGLLSIILLFKMRDQDNILVLIGWFISNIIVLSLTAFISQFVFGRSYLYLTFSWCILQGLLYSFMYNNRFKIRFSKSLIRVPLLTVFILLIVIIPLTHSGRDPTTYITSSLQTSISYLSERESNTNLFISDYPTLFLIKYTKAKTFYENNDGLSTKLTQRPIDKLAEESIKDGKDINEIIDEMVEYKHEPRSIFVANHLGRNIFELKLSEGKSYDIIESEYSSSHNIVISSGNVRIYSNWE